VIPAEFEEKSYEAPLYNQLERGQNRLFVPGQVLENTLGFDAQLAPLANTVRASSQPAGCARCLPPFLVPYSARREACSVRLASQDIGNAFPASSVHHSRQRSQGLPSGCRSSAIHAAVHWVL